jgi:hypothetical protein
LAGLRLVSPEQLLANEDQAAQAEEAARLAANQNTASSLSAFIDNEFNRMVRHRDGASGWSDRLTTAMQVFNGKYGPTKLMEIRRFGGSEIYARLIATKCRGAASLLRDIYLNADKPWGLKPTPKPTLPDDVLGDIQTLVQAEAQHATMGGVQPPPDEDMVADRTKQLISTAERAAIKKARLEADRAFKSLDDLLVEGGFYDALNAGLIDITMFPFMCLKGPVVRTMPRVRWTNGQAVQEEVPVMQWNRVSPFDVWWTPGVSNIRDAAVIERTRITRSELNQVIDLPGYNTDAIREVLQWYGQSGYVETMASTADTQRAVMESREDPRMNESGLLDMLEYHGYVQGRLLLEQGMMSADQIEDPLRDYFVDAFKIGRYVIKVQMSPSLRKRPYYYVTSFEKVPGTVVGNALPDILADIQDATNAALRSLVNNMSIASGPQVVINDDRIAENTDGDELYPWKRWHVETDPLGSNNSQQPVVFFQPNSNAQELLGVYEKFTQIADELSAIPRYVTGSERTGGAGRTASGLAMLMGNAAKILQTVAANIDNDVIQPIIEELYDLVMLTDQTGLLRGDESITVLGVNVAMQRETQRQRSLEFLQITGNPIDMQIMGPRGRATVLRSVADGIGLDGEDIVPPDEEIQAMAMGGPPGAPGGQPGAPPGAGPPVPPPGGQPPGGKPSAPQAPQMNVVGSTPGAGAGTKPNPAQGPV